MIPLLANQTAVQDDTANFGGLGFGMRKILSKYERLFDVVCIQRLATTLGFLCRAHSFILVEQISKNLDTVGKYLANTLAALVLWRHVS